MTGLIAFVFSTRQGVVTGQWTEVIDVNATFLVAFMFATGTFFGATFLAAGIIGPGGELATFYHLIHVTTTTFNCSLLVTGRTIARVAFKGAVMGIGGFATFQGLTTDSFTNRYGIQT